MTAEEYKATRQRLGTQTPARSGAGGVIYADGYCSRCSNLSRRLTAELARCGVPTGTPYWQQTWAIAKLRALDSYETSLRKLLLALDAGKPEKVAAAKEAAEFQIYLHEDRYRRMRLRSQSRALAREAGGGGAEPVGERDGASERSGACSQSDDQSSATPSRVGGAIEPKA